MTAKESEKQAYGTVTLTEQAPLFENLDQLSKPIYSPAPKYMEDFGQDFGYILYRSEVKGPRDDWQLHIDKVHDRAQIFIDGSPRATFERWDPAGQERADIRLPMADGESVTLDILAENMGRVNYGRKLWDHKGVCGVRFHLQHHFGWHIYPLPMKDLSRLQFKALDQNDLPISTPTFLRGILKIPSTPKDTFLRLDGFTKGFVTVNGINIGRYFNTAGPQRTLYVPAPFLKQGNNEIIVFESDSTSATQIELLDQPDLGETE